MRYYLAKSCKGQEYLYNRESVIDCGCDKKKVEKIRDFLNQHNDTTAAFFKLKPSETWFIHTDIEAFYKLSTRNGFIKVKYI